MSKKSNVLIVARPAVAGGTSVFLDGKKIFQGMNAVDAFVFLIGMSSTLGEVSLTIDGEKPGTFARMAHFENGQELGRLVAHQEAHEEAMDRVRVAFLTDVAQALMEPPVIEMTIIDLGPVQQERPNTIPDANRYTTERVRPQDFDQLKGCGQIDCTACNPVAQRRP